MPYPALLDIFDQLKVEVPRCELLLVIVNIVIALFFLLASLPAHAGVQPNFPKSSELQLVLGLNANRYFVKDPQNQPLPDRRMSNLGANIFWRGKTVKNKWEALADVDAQVGINNSDFRYLNINEAYIGVNPSSSGQFHAYLGRKVLEWSELEEIWSLGLFQPRFRWDYLEERSSGLTGLFGVSNSEWFELSTFASPIFIPEQGAPQDISNGDCRSASPWFYCPNASVQLFNQNTDVKFHLEIPPISKLIAYFGTGASLRLGRNEGLHWRNSAMYKPMNQLLLSYEGRLDLSTQELPAIIHPRVLYHTVLASELGYTKDSFSSLLSLISEKPERDSTPGHWNNQEASEALLAGGAVRGKLFGEGTGATTGEVSYLYRQDGNAPDSGPFSADGSGIFEPRYAFKNAYSILVRSPIIPSMAPYIQSALRFIADANNNGNILMADLAVFPARRLRVQLGVDLLGSNTRNAIDFISRYQRNDRVRGGLHYFF